MLNARVGSDSIVQTFETLRPCEFNAYYYHMLGGS